MKIDSTRGANPFNGPQSIAQISAPDSDDAQALFHQRLQQVLSKSNSNSNTEIQSQTPFDSLREASVEKDELKVAFCDFVGQTLFGKMISSMRSTQQEPAYFHGGQAERIFQKQLDQELTQSISKASADSVAGPMYDLFRMKRTP